MNNQRYYGKWTKNNSSQIIDIVEIDENGICKGVNSIQGYTKAELDTNWTKFDNTLISDPYSVNKEGKPLKIKPQSSEEITEEFKQKHKKPEVVENEQKSVDVPWKAEVIENWVNKETSGIGIASKEYKLVQSLLDLKFKNSNDSLDLNIKLNFPIPLTMIKSIVNDAEDIDKVKFFEILLNESKNDIFKAITKSIEEIV